MTYVCLITGASSGIGEATARRFARASDVRLVLVARRKAELHRVASDLGGAPTVIAADLTDPGTPERIRATIEREHGALHMLVNNAGAGWGGTFADSGWRNVDRHMRINFEAPLRLTEALLPLLRRTARDAGTVEVTDRRVCIVNVASTAGRVSRPGRASYSASKFALIGWSDGLHAEERPHGIHVGLVLPGFVSTPGFPGTELLAKRTTRWLVGDVDAVAEAIEEVGPGGHAERYTPRFYRLAAALRVLAPGLVRRAVGGGTFSTVPAD